MVEKPSAGFYSRTTWGKSKARRAEREPSGSVPEGGRRRLRTECSPTLARGAEPGSHRPGPSGGAPALLRKSGSSTFLESRTFGSGGSLRALASRLLVAGLFARTRFPSPHLPRAACAPSRSPGCPRSARSNMQSLNITPEQFSRLLRDHNLTREHFIALYGLRPLVYTPELPGRAKLAFVLTGGLIFALALFGNALVVYVVTRSKAMRTVTNIFICSLALSDLLIAFFCIPVTMLQNISDNWLGGESACFTSSRPSRGPLPPLARTQFL